MLTIVAPGLVPSGDVCLGEYCVQLMREACARSMCSGLVLSGILIRPDVELFGEHNEDS